MYMVLLCASAWRVLRVLLHARQIAVPRMWVELQSLWATDDHMQTLSLPAPRCCGTWCKDTCKDTCPGGDHLHVTVPNDVHAALAAGPFCNSPFGHARPPLKRLLGSLASPSSQPTGMPGTLPVVLLLLVLAAALVGGARAELDPDQAAEISRAIREQFRATGFNWVSPKMLKGVRRACARSLCRTHHQGCSAAAAVAAFMLEAAPELPCRAST